MSDMKIDDLLDIMDEMLEESSSLPFAGGKRIVDIDKMHDVIDDIRINLPAAIRNAKQIENDRNNIIATARREADHIIKLAEERARTIVSREAVVKAAGERAAEINAQAQAKSRETNAKMTEYCDNLLKKTEEQMSRHLDEVKTLRQTLRQSGKSATVRTTPRKIL